MIHSLNKALSCFVAITASAAHAGALITLTPTVAGPYQPGQTVTVDVSVTASQAIQARLLGFDFSKSDSALTLMGPDGPDADSIQEFQFDFSSLLFGSALYAVFPNFKVPQVVYSSQTPNNLGILALPANTPFHAGSLQVQLPNAPGTYTLDAANFLATDTNAGARIDFDFANTQTWSTVNDGSIEITGGLLILEVSGIVHPDPDCNHNGILDECETECSGDICGCQGPFLGQFSGPSQGAVSATLSSVGQLSFHFQSPTGLTLFQTSAELSDDGVIDGTGQKIVVDGTFDFDNCTATGTWQLMGGTTGEWTMHLTRACLPDCNGNHIPDECEIRDALSLDCNENAVPDECELATGASFDCNSNDIPDKCDIASTESDDCQFDGVPDECQLAGDDCNTNLQPDECDITTNVSSDCQSDGVPDECQLLNDDCNANSQPDECDIANEVSQDCQLDGVPDDCQLHDNDCNANLQPDECDIATHASQDCQHDGVPDECQLQNNDCNTNLRPDECDIANGFSFDCNANDTPDECEEPPVFRIVSSDPPGGIIDARQDRSITGQTQQGIDRVRLRFSCKPYDNDTRLPISVDSFEISSTSGIPPLVLSLIEVSGEAYSYDLLFSDPIPSGAWTTLFVHVVSPDDVPLVPSANRVTFGFLPGDANSDRKSSPSDILDLINNLNHVRVPPLYNWQCDTDRSGVCAPADLLREIDLLNGIHTSRPWNGVSLPPRP